MLDDAVAAPDRPGLRGYARILRRRWRTALLVLLVPIGLALVFSLTAPRLYLASADVLIEPSAADVQASGMSEIDADEVATQTQVVTSLPVARLVEERLDLASTPDLSETVSVQAVGTSRILRITAEDTDPTRAAETANTVAAAYLQYREQDSVGRYEQARERLAREQSEVERRLDEVERLIDARSTGLPALQSERRTLLTNLAQIATQTDALTDALTSAAAGGELIRAAAAPTTPVSPRLALNLILGLLVGAVLAVGAALLRDRLDDVVHDEEAARRALDAVVLGRIPPWSDRVHQGRLVTLQEPHGPASEEYQRLGVNVRFMLAAETRPAGAVLVVTSGQEGEGKTVTASNLAVSLARLGLRVALVDADLRRASLAGRFGLGDPPGLSDLLVGEEDPSTYGIGVGVDDLTVVPAGTMAPNPAALLGSPRLRRVLADLAARFDLVVIDSPPVLTGADTLELAAVADMVLVVARERVSHGRRLSAVAETLRQVSVETVGMVCNAVGDSSTARYSYAHRERTTAPLHPVETTADESGVSTQHGA